MTALTVSPEAWHQQIVTLKDEGFGYFDGLGALDDIGRANTFTVVIRLRRHEDGALAQVRTQVPRTQPELDSVGDLFAGARWHEREAAELFGIEFVGGDRRRLLLDLNFDGAPLRKDEVLAARSAVSWPGAKEPGESDASPSRRRMVPPGVPDPAVWGDRDPAGGPLDPVEVAASAVGGRVRRRHR